MHTSNALEVQQECGDQRHGRCDPAADQGVAQGVVDHVQQLMDEHDGQCHFKCESEQVLQICSCCGAGHEHDASLDHFWNFPFVMHEGDPKIELPNLNAGLLRALFTPGTRKH